uniref:Bm11789 n=1 Tax=Brugia malayi TaxID=6279 RepID=A0A1I9GA98_BRUMA|nr:Bm11789 [Brugia malayi]
MYVTVWIKRCQLPSAAMSKGNTRLCAFTCAAFPLRESSGPGIAVLLANPWLRNPEHTLQGPLDSIPE